MGSHARYLSVREVSGGRRCHMSQSDNLAARLDPPPFQDKYNPECEKYHRTANTNIAIPTTGLKSVPRRVSFSITMTPASANIHAMLPTPTPNITSISAQQQP